MSDKNKWITTTELAFSIKKSEATAKRYAQKLVKIEPKSIKRDGRRLLIDSTKLSLLDELNNELIMSANERKVSSNELDDERKELLLLIKELEQRLGEVVAKSDTKTDERVQSLERELVAKNKQLELLLDRVGELTESTQQQNKLLANLQLQIQAINPPKGKEQQPLSKYLFWIVGAMVVIVLLFSLMKLLDAF